jgi:NTE family protein
MTTAVVLAGGGLTGIAWEIGVLLGLRKQGHDIVRDADLIIGTSAGSVVGTQLSQGLDLTDLYARQQQPDENEISPRIDIEVMTQVYSNMRGGGTQTDEQRQHIGKIALNNSFVDWPTRRAVIEGRVKTDEWPDRNLIVTTIDAESGEFRTWSKDDGVGLIDAVASSCAVAGIWPCVPINGHMYYDGGFRNSANAFLATGFNTVWVLAPLSGDASPAVETEVEDLRAAGTTVRYITTDDTAKNAMGLNSLDPRVRGAAAEQGLRQGHEFAELLGRMNP